MSKKNIYTNINVHKDKRKAVLIDEGLHQRLKLLAVEEKTTIKNLIEGALADLLAVRITNNDINTSKENIRSNS